VYPGPIGAILNPQLHGTASDRDKTLPYASTLCGRCYEVCPVAIDIPEVLVHLRGTVVDGKRASAADPEVAAMRSAAFVMASPFRFAAAERLVGRVGGLLARDGTIGRLPGPLAGWSDARDTPAPPPQPFRAWWRRHRRSRNRGRR
jgi:L-lactate dehydrogenase complex protein LldF